MSKVIANTFRHTAASSDAITLDNSGNATINGNLSVTGTNNAKYDDTNLRRDLNTLALQTAVDTNRKAYNLQNSFIEQFEDDTGILTQTTVDRDSSEFVASVYNASTNIIPEFHKIHQCGDAPYTSSWAGTNGTNDSVVMDFQRCDGANNHYPGVGVDYLFDLAGDFEINIFCNDSNGDISNNGWHQINGFITTNTSKAAGANPTDLWETSLPNEDVSTLNGVHHSWQDVLHDDYVTTLGIGSLSSGDHNSIAHSTLSDPWTRSLDANSGQFAFASYLNADSGPQKGGINLTYTKSANTLVIKLIANNSRTTLEADQAVTITEVPRTGRFILVYGNADPSSSKVASFTYKDGTASDYSSAYAETTSATGTLISNAQTASSSRTKVSGTILYKDASGTATLGTDLKVSFSCDNGSNWTALDATSGNYTAGSDFSTGIKTAYLKEVTCTAGTQIKYKVEWANQASGSKVTQLHGIAMNY